MFELAPQILLQTKFLGNNKKSPALEIAVVATLAILTLKAINSIPNNTPDRYGVALGSVQAQLSSSYMSRSHYLRYIQLVSDLTVQYTSTDNTGYPI